MPTLPDSRNLTEGQLKQKQKNDEENAKQENLKLAHADFMFNKKLHLQGWRPRGRDEEEQQLYEQPPEGGIAIQNSAMLTRLLKDGRYQSKAHPEYHVVLQGNNIRIVPPATGKTFETVLTEAIHVAAGGKGAEKIHVDWPNGTGMHAASGKNFVTEEYIMRILDVAEKNHVGVSFGENVWAFLDSTDTNKLIPPFLTEKAAHNRRLRVEERLREVNRKHAEMMQSTEYLAHTQGFVQNKAYMDYKKKMDGEVKLAGADDAQKRQNLFDQVIGPDNAPLSDADKLSAIQSKLETMSSRLKVANAAADEVYTHLTGQSDLITPQSSADELSRVKGSLDAVHTEQNKLLTSLTNEVSDLIIQQGVLDAALDSKDNNDPNSRSLREQRQSIEAKPEPTRTEDEKMLLQDIQSTEAKLASVTRVINKLAHNPTRGVDALNGLENKVKTKLDDAEQHVPRMR